MMEVKRHTQFIPLRRRIGDTILNRRRRHLPDCHAVIIGKEGANEAVEYCAEWLSKQGLTVNVIVNNGYKMLVSIR